MIKIPFARALLIAFPLLLSQGEGFTQELKSSQWTQWRGPNRDAWVEGSTLPKDLSEDSLKTTWSVELGPSYSGPIVSDDRVFVTETVNKKVEQVSSLDRTTGEIIWQTEWEGSLSVPFFANSNGSWIRATPALDGSRLYVAGIRDLLVCLDASSGDVLWKFDFVKELEASLPSFGSVSSPLVIGEHVYVQAGGGFCKIDKKSGKLIWRVLDDGGGMFGSAFSSPYFTELEGVPQILVQTRTALNGVNPEDGKVLWEQEVPAFRGMNILTPTVVGNSIFTSSYGGRSYLFTVKKQAEDWSVEETWTNKAQGYMSSPLIIDKHVYFHLKNQRFTCINLKTGEETFTTTPFGKYWSSITDGKKILALDEEGELLLINANPEKFDLVDQRTISENAWAHIAVSRKNLFVRNLDKLTMYQWD
ncbi:MAG: PQQ-binding-like beta-propeller repeat protein [Pirellulales bacterium]